MKYYIIIVDSVNSCSVVLHCHLINSSYFRPPVCCSLTINLFQGGGQYLECLDVSYCGRGDDGAVSALVECLEHCSRLRELKVAGWGLTGELIPPLCKYAQAMK